MTDSRKNTLLAVSCIVLFYLLLRIPLANKPLGHDEIYNTSIYLGNDALSKEGGFSWKTDWKRQIAVHPPFLPCFYYAWIRLFGDSEISLHVPAIFFGLSGIILMYFAGSLIFKSGTAFLAAMATTFSIAHTTYSTEAGHAIFEPFILAASLLCLSKIILSEKKRLLWLLIILNFLGIFIFYHYLAYLLIQTALFWFERRKLGISGYYFAAVLVIMLCFFGLFAFSFLKGRYSYDFWMQPDFMTLSKVMGALPYRGIGVWPVPARYAHLFIFRNFFQIFALPFLAVFTAGCGRIILEARKGIEQKNALRIALLALFAIPIILYMAVAVTGRKFGEPRNFFYLLTPYFLIVFYGLELLCRGKKAYKNTAAAILAFFLVGGMFHSVYYWKPLYSEREAIKKAAEEKTPLLSIPLARTASWPLQYYAKKYGRTWKR